MELRRWTAVGWTVAMLAGVVMSAGDAAAQSAPVDGEVGVVALDGSAASRQAEATVSESLGTRQVTIVRQAELERRVAQHQVAAAPPELMAQFSGVTAAIAEGIERFFYRGVTDAIAILEPVVELGLEHPEVLARRPDIADQIHQAGIVLLRAYRQNGDEERASELARSLVRTAPGKQLSTSLVPPDIVAMIEAEKEATLADGATLTIVASGDATCIRHVNGVPLTADRVVVAAKMPYYATLICASGVGAVWQVEAAAGARVDVPLVEGDLFEQNGQVSRAQSAARLAAIRHWSGVATVLGISANGSSTDDGLLIGRVDANGTARWSDGHQEETVRRTLARVFPEFEFDEEVREIEQPARASGSILGPVLAGGGVAVGVLGGVLTYRANRMATELRCSPVTTGSKEGCDGVTPIYLADEEAFQAERRYVRKNQYIAYGTLGAGVATALFGGWWWWRSSAGSSAPAVSVWWTPEAGGATIVGRF